MTETEYRAHPAISKSSLFKLTESPEKFKYYLEHPQEPTPALVFGRTFHKLALQRDEFDDEFAVAPSLDRRTKAGKEEYANFLESSAGKTVISSDFFKQAEQMSQALYENELVAKLLKGEKEKPFFWKDDITAEECKCRVDCITKVDSINVIVDLKTTLDASTDNFMREAIRYGYDLQAAMYKEGVKQCTGLDCAFVFVSIEKDPPYCINIMQADDLFVKHGYDLFRELIGVYHDCKASGNWFGYLGKYDMINNLSLPAWMAKEVE